MLTRLPLLVVTAAAAVACSSSSGGGKAHVTATNGHPDPAAVAAKFGCTGYTPQSGQIEFFAATEGDCKYKGDDVQILTFTSSASFKKWRDAAKTAVGGNGTLVLGSDYSIEANNADQASAIATAVGGTTQ